MATDPFPVNRLPYLARRNVLAVMNMPELLMASTCSQNYKAFVKSLFIRPRTCSILIHESELHFTSLYGDDGFSVFFDSTDFSVEGPCTPYFKYLVNTSRNPENQPLKHSTFGAREWVQHFLEVLNIGKITAILFNTGAEDFDPEDLSKVFGNYQLLELLFGNEDYSDEYLRKINDLFTPTLSLLLNKKLSNEEDFHRKATNSNVELTNIWYPIDLAGLSVINCPSMAIGKTNMTPIDFNSFIKRWINQTAATKLKQMHIRFPERRFGEDYLPAVFDGVDNQFFEEERTYPILLHTLKTLGEEHVFKDGYKIERNDGVNASILFCSLSPRFHDVFFVVHSLP
ncbi:CBN-FBXB-9 protein [Caenorhabditis brenneri]|uniref:CBN-FBXB-9 protein n=1 Tax=Caenorhabditis brenneri TaxID=135651 RepID=G0N832_CAEBE|nr:CBN-FBXB-9 protein [Caenorhabditis brenneri]